MQVNFFSPGGLPSEEDVDLLLDPVLVVGGVGVGGPLVDQAGEVRQLVHKLEQLEGGGGNEVSFRHGDVHGLFPVKLMAKHGPNKL